MGLKMSDSLSITSVSAKIMLSYDYSHFEIALSADTIISDKPGEMKAANELRKKCQRLADEAVRQYKKAKEYEQLKLNDQYGFPELRKKGIAIRENFPESEWTPEQKAIIKKLRDIEYRLEHEYNYDDDPDWDEDEF